MSATLSTVLRPPVTKRPGAFARLSSACLEGLARFALYRADIARFRALDDHALRDIGLERSQIEAAVYGFWNVPERTGRE